MTTRLCLEPESNRQSASFETAEKDTILLKVINNYQEVNVIGCIIAQ